MASAQPGETIELAGETVEGTLTIPAGVNVEGKDGEELVIEPEEGEPGIVLEGDGESRIQHIRVRGATGTGIAISGRTVTLENVEVSGTKKTDTEPGHGIAVEDAPSFLAVSISSTGNDGDGLHVEGTDSVAVIHPEFAPVPADLLGQASRAVIHPEFMPQDEGRVRDPSRVQPVGRRWHLCDPPGVCSGTR